MPSIDMKLEQMRQYVPPLYRPGDFEGYWKETIAEALRQPINAELIPFQLPAAGVECYAVRFDGFGGGRLAGWYARPANPPKGGKSPGVCLYHGYSGRGQRPMEFLHLVHQGFCVLSMDCRGQNGQSQNAATFAEGHYVGWMTQGIRDPQTYYYRYVYADAVRALELLAHREEVDASRLTIGGTSQGGGITLAVAAFSDRPKLALPDIPFLCDFVPRDRDHAGGAVSGDSCVHQDAPERAGAGHPHAGVLRLPEPRAVDPVQDDPQQLPLGRHLPAEHDLRGVQSHDGGEADGDLSVSQARSAVRAQ